MKYCTHCEDENAHMVFETEEERRDAERLSERMLQAVHTGNWGYRLSNYSMDLLDALHNGDCDHEE